MLMTSAQKQSHAGGWGGMTGEQIDAGIARDDMSNSTSSSSIFAQLDKVCQIKNSDTPDIITVVIDEKNLLGKNFGTLPNKSIKKTSAVAVARGIACQYYVPDFATFQKVLQIVSENPHAAIVNAGFKHAAIGEQFIFLSKKALIKLGLKPEDVTKVSGMTAFARLKDHATPSTWQLFDRDEDRHTPDWARKQTFDEWRQSLDKILPGVARVVMLRAHSSSARVLRADGTAAGGGNGHTWIKVADAADAERTRTAIIARALELGMSWLKPRISKRTGEICGQGFATIVDASVWTTGRLVFAGRPTCSSDMTITDQQFELIDGEKEVLDTSLAVVSALKTYRASAKKGTPLRLSRDATGYHTVIQNLQLETEIELEDGSTTTIAALMSELGDKVRCQAPFRESESMAAFVALDGKGNPFVFDSGTNTKHVLAKSISNGMKCKELDNLIRELKSRLGRLIGWDNVDAVLNDETLISAWDSIFFSPVGSKYTVINNNEELIELSEPNLRNFGVKRTFGYAFHHDMLEEVIAEMNLGELDLKSLRKSLSALELAPLIENLKLYKQAKSLNISVDMFARRGSLSVADNIATIALPHRRFVPQMKVEKYIVEQVFQDYIAHFPEFPALLGIVLHARFATDRRHAFIWLHSPSSWGKGFMLAIFNELGLVFEVSAAEIEKMIAGGPVGLSLTNTLRAWIMFVDEFKSASSELKLLNSRISISPKNQLRCTVQLYTKIFASAESVRSLVGDGAEAQFNNRFAYLSPATREQKLEDRALFCSLGKGVYLNAMVNYVAAYLNDGVDRLCAIGVVDSSKVADEYIETYQAAHLLNETFGSLDDSVNDIVDEIQKCLIRFASHSNNLYLQPSDLAGLSHDLINTLRRTTVTGLVSEGGNSKSRRKAIVLSDPVPFIKRYIAQSGDRSTIGKMQYKADAIAAKLHMRTEPYKSNARVRVYDEKGKEIDNKRGIVIFFDDEPELDVPF